MRTASLRFSVATVALALVAGSCSGTGPELAGMTGASTTTVTAAPTTTTSTTTTTAAPSTTVRVATAPPPGFGRGSRGPEVQAIEQRLADLRYDVGKVDGVFDMGTHHAVTAFQKVQGLSRTGRATPDVVEVMGRVGPPGTMLPSAEADRVEVDLKRQVLFLVRAGTIDKILAISTGSGKRYCVDGECARAVTPGGSFRVTRRIHGWRTSRLGKLYNPLYFNGGIAIHGAPSVPAYPASHGCVRIPMSSAAWFPGLVPNGTPVYVLGGPKAPVPFNEKAPGDPSATSTTSSTSTPGPTTTSTTTPPVTPPSSTTSTTQP